MNRELRYCFEEKRVSVNSAVIKDIPFSEIAGFSIESFLRSTGYTSNIITRLKSDEGSVLLNGQREYMRTLISPGDELKIIIRENESSQNILPVKIKISLLYEDEDLLVINKPSDMPVHPSLNNYDNTLGNALAYYFASRNIPFVFRCINRLDRDTTGLTIVAKNMLSAAVLYSSMDRREIRREYLALVRDEDKRLPDSYRIDKPIGRVSESIIKRCVDFENGRRAVTNCEIVKRSEAFALIRLRLETGRTHQIRVHMSDMGFPLLGDGMYGGESGAMQRTALHSAALEFKHPVSGGRMYFEAELPEDMERLL